MPSLDEAIQIFRSNPKYADLVHFAYLGEDVVDSAQRFYASSEFSAVQALISSKIQGATVLDLGAGVGIASYAFLRAGAALSYAIEPDRSDIVGIGAMRRVVNELPVAIIEGYGEDLPMVSSSIDIYYTRQVLHHTRDLGRVLREAFRVLKPGGVFLACREHVANTPEALQAFLDAHPTHQIAGGEHAYMLDQYRTTILNAGFHLQAVLGPWDNLINTFPQIQSEEVLEQYPASVLERRLGQSGRILARLPFVRRAVWASIKRRLLPGALHSFYAIKQV